MNILSTGMTKMEKRSIFRHWYGVNILFMETKRGQNTAFRIYTLVKENTQRKAISKAIKLWEKAPHPHGEVPGTHWKYLGPIDIYECFTAPVAGGMVGFLKAAGKTWEDALEYIKPESEFALSTMDWSKKPSPDNLYCVDLVYFVRPKKKIKFGKITVCTCIVKSANKEKALQEAYSTAVRERTRRLVIKVRKAFKIKSLVEFVGISEISPIYRKVSDGMEFDRTIQSYKSEKSILRLLPKKIDDLIRR